MGYTVSISKNMQVAELKHQLDLGLPVLCLIQAWPERQVDYQKDWDDGHYVVAVGYDETRIYFMDPSTLGNYTFIPNQEFIDRWHDTDGKERLVRFGMTISKDKPRFVADEIKPLQ